MNVIAASSDKFRQSCSVADPRFASSNLTSINNAAARFGIVPCRDLHQARRSSMTRTKKSLSVVFAAAALCAAPLSLQWSAATVPSVVVDSASARVGHPLSPGSVAGVNRRVNRRGYYGAAAVGAAAVGTAAYGAYRYNSQPACGYYPYPACY
jgi:hypothetical protein